MIRDKPGSFRRALSFVLDIGADPADDEYTRTIKRIWWITASFGILAAFSATLIYLLAGNAVLACLFLLSFVLFVTLYIYGIRHPARFRAITEITLFYFVGSSVLVTILLGGIWAADGLIMIGLMGPLLGLIYFRDRRLAAGLFVAYAAFVMALSVAGAAGEPQELRRAGLDPLTFWLGFVVVSAFIFGVIYFFVVQRDKAHRRLAEEKARSESLLRRIEADLEQAARIQKDLLPKAGPRLEGFDISGINVPCYEVGGDYFDFLPIDADRLAVVIADVSGKGISASLLMASLRAALLAEIRPDCALDRLAARLSDFIYASSGPSSFVTFFFGELDRRTAEMHYVNAGHNPPFIIGRDGAPRTLGVSGFPLGMFAGAVYETRTVPLLPGDLAVLYTDGIPEARSPEGVDYSEVRLINRVHERSASTAEEICAGILGDVEGFVSGVQPCDDITVVVVKRRAAAS
jgi:serine phosphatase RsbU (regulator of sigma subunit)